MQDFLLIAGAHFLALLSPGPDFFLIARSSLAHGWRGATGACIGIALANGVFIAAAFGGLSVLQAGSKAFLVVQLAGCAYLFYLGWLFLRHAGKSSLAPAPATGKAHWRGGLVMGFVSAILNPKNALFYVSLATVLAGRQTRPGTMAAYGAWMVFAVLAWDMAVALAIGSAALRQRFARALPSLERLSGVMLVGLAAVLLVQAGSGSR
ncbi:LysE family translocator [Janthinobacterium sp. FT14W]|uniref:LysE family translocator n=1 Tax=Janthinobacterium sp. FT14W TaxID=2654253 RepID=UPI0012656877|nr:LysE family translocator [Janthinobacterium sp. FT14W]KAB8059900.1 LysE family translocator [Janthinobacterium sp. FT14W]